MQQWEYSNILVYRSAYKLGANGDTEPNADWTYGYWGTDIAGHHVPISDALAELGDEGWELCTGVVAGLVPFGAEGKQVAPHMLYFRRSATTSDHA